MTRLLGYALLLAVCVVDFVSAQSSGSLVGWGEKAATGIFHGLGHKADDAIVAWGNYEYCQSDVPSPGTGMGGESPDDGASVRAWLTEVSS